MTKRHRGAYPALVAVLAVSLLSGPTPAAAGDLGDFERARVLRVMDLQRGPGTPAIPMSAAKSVGVAAADGAIVGSVRGLDPDAHGSAWVLAWPADSLYAADGTLDDNAYTEARATVAPDGTYRLEGLAAGSYYVSAAAKGYETRYYDDAADQASATVVVVPDQGTVEGIDFTLAPYRAGEGSIEGAVTSDADGHPIAGVVVHAFVPDNPFLYGAAETDEDGRYAIRGLSSGRYVVEAWHEDYMPEFHRDATVYEEAVLVEVVEPEPTGGIDFELATGGSISGVVRDAGGGPVAGAYVSATMAYGWEGWADGGPTGVLAPSVGGGWAVTGESGAYHMGGLPTGEYLVLAQTSTQRVNAAAWYDGAQAYEDATPVAVTLGQETPGIDITLTLPVTDSAIAGRVTDSQGRPVAKAFVTVQEASGWVRGDSVPTDDAGSSEGSIQQGGGADAQSFPAGVGPAPVWAFVTTAEDGRYVVDELPAGTYIVSAASEGGWEYVQRWYVDAATPQDATEVALEEGERRVDIDIALPLRVSASSISGTVRDQDGRPLMGAFIEIGPAAGPDPVSSSEPSRLWAYGQADDTGAYRVDRLPAGTYTVHASYSRGDRYGHSWYDGVDDPRYATPVSLAEGEARGDIDLQLVVRPIYGDVAGTVSDAATGMPLGPAYVVLSPVGRDAARGAPLWYWAPWAVTDESGGFRMGWIPEGSYSLTVYADGASGSCVSPDGDPHATTFEVRGGETTRCDVDLSVRRDGEGVIAGTVTTGYEGSPQAEGPAGAAGPGGTPDTASDANGPWVVGGVPEIAVVLALPVASTDTGSPYTAVTGRDGGYELRGLPSGDYVLMCFAPGHIGTYYDGAYSPEQAQTVRVEDEQRLQAIDFRLADVYRYLADGAQRGSEGDAAPADGATGSGAMVYGNIVDDSGQPVADATVYLLDAAEQPVAFAQTGSGGAFELSGVAPGQYRVYAGKLGFAGTYNGNQRDFAAAAPLTLGGGQVEVSLVLPATVSTAVEEDVEADGAVPRSMALHRNYPNPFNPETRIAFTVAASGPATLRIYDAVGQQVAVLFDQTAEAGRAYEMVFRAGGFAGGVYFYALESGGRRLARPMVLLK